MSVITVNYTPQYIGSHRICYRKQPDLTYCCLTDATASTPGIPKVFLITISDPPCATVPGVDPDACANQIYEGYVQPSCELEASAVNRVPWSVSYTPDPDCANREVCCINQVPLVNGYLSITNPGDAYDITLSPIAVTVVRHPFDPVPPSILNDAIVEVIIIGTQVSSANVVFGGLYGLPPTFIIPPPTLLVPPPVTATMVATIPCGSGNRFYIDCNGVTTTVELGLGECINSCFPKLQAFFYEEIGLITPDNTYYSYLANGCCDCTTCRNYLVTLTTPGAAFLTRYVTCKNGGATQQVQTTLLISGVPTILNCLIPESIYVNGQPNATFTIVDTGPCATCP